MKWSKLLVKSIPFIRRLRWQLLGLEPEQDFFRSHHLARSAGNHFMQITFSYHGYLSLRSLYLMHIIHIDTYYIQYVYTYIFIYLFIWYMIYTVYVNIKTIKYMVYVHAMILRRHMRKTPKKRRDHLGSPEITLPILAIKRLEKVGLFPTWSTYYHMEPYIIIIHHISTSGCTSLSIESYRWPSPLLLSSFVPPAWQASSKWAVKLRFLPLSNSVRVHCVIMSTLD